MYYPDDRQKQACIDLVDRFHESLTARQPIEFRALGDEDYFLYLSNLCHQRHGYYLGFELTDDPPRTYDVAISPNVLA